MSDANEAATPPIHDFRHRVSCETIDGGGAARYRASCSCGFLSVEMSTKALAFHVSAAHLKRTCAACSGRADVIAHEANGSTVQA